MEEIRTGRLLLRPFRESDYDDLFEYLSQLENDEFEGYPGITYENGRKHLKYRIESDEFYAIEWIILIALIKIINIISGYIVQKKFVAVHSVMNKVTGVLLFILPLTFSIVPLMYSAIPVCLVSTFAAVQEGHIIRTGRNE